MIELRHGHNIDESKLVGLFTTEDDCFAEMINREKFDIPYFRVWGTDTIKKVDYGKHTKFYFIVQLDKICDKSSKK